MNYYIDNEKQEIVLEDQSRLPLYSPEGFKIISDLWLKVGWDQKHLYSFTWLGRPIIQLPDDILRIQEVIYTIRPDVIVETGVAHGGSLILYASLCKAMEKGRVIGVDIEIRPHNRKAIEAHALFDFITLIEADSISKETVEQVAARVGENESTLVILDSDHSYNHVLKELQLYSELVSEGSYILVTDGSQEYLHVSPRAQADYPGYVDTWETNNPKKAAEDFVANTEGFEIVEPAFLFNEGNIDYRISHWPSAFVKKLKT
jgi:cephalosporin hydroxylase